MSGRLFWSKDGTELYTLLGIYTTPVTANYLDGVANTSDSLGFGSTTSLLLKLPCPINFSNIKIQINNSSNITVLTSNNSSDGLNGSWITNYSNTITSNVLTSISITNSVSWMKISSSNYIGIKQLQFFGLYYSPFCRFFDANNLEYTQEYPLEFPLSYSKYNYDNYLQFKVYNNDSVSSHNFLLELRTIDINGDQFISDHFSLSIDNGFTKVPNLTISGAPISFCNNGNPIRVYSNVTPSHNMGDGIHYFTILATKVS